MLRQRESFRPTCCDRVALAGQYIRTQCSFCSCKCMRVCVAHMRACAYVRAYTACMDHTLCVWIIHCVYRSPWGPGPEGRRCLCTSRPAPFMDAVRMSCQLCPNQVQTSTVPAQGHHTRQHRIRTLTTHQITSHSCTHNTLETSHSCTHNTLDNITLMHSQHTR